MGIGGGDDGEEEKRARGLPTDGVDGVAVASSRAGDAVDGADGEEDQGRNTRQVGDGEDGKYISLPSTDSSACEPNVNIVM